MDNKFGMFIHWGLYALDAFQEHGRWMLGYSDEEYQKLAANFNPTEYDPEEWVLLAKNAGMKYICFTTKHHDGFCMWDTKYTDFNIMNTPYGKDVLKMLADACQKHGMLLSLYYSCPDWHHPDAFNPRSIFQSASVNCTPTDNAVYREYVKNQMRELMTNYGEIYTLFWDIPPCYEDPSINALVRSLQPNILINDRGWDKGDFATPERTVPEGNRFTSRTEACQSVGEQAWGYRAHEHYYPVKFLMSSIDKVMAMGGSYLLNVGPMANGKISERATAIVERVGDWYNRMGGALENTEQDHLDLRFANTADSYICNYKDGKTYFHFYNGLNATALVFNGLGSLPQKARLLNNGQELTIRYEPLPHRANNIGHTCFPVLSIADIPTDDFPAEPIVVEIDWYDRA